LGSEGAGQIEKHEIGWGQDQMVTRPKFLALATVVAVTLHVIPAEAASARSKVFEEFADTIVSQIAKQESWGGKHHRHATGERARIAIRPFDESDIPISAAAAGLFNRQLKAALQRHPDRSFDLVERQNVNFLINDMRQTGVVDDAAGDPIIALMKKAGNIDVLIIGSIARADENIKLGYEAVRMIDGVTMAATEARGIELKTSERPAGMKLTSFNQAVKSAARALHDGASDMKELILSGIRFEDSGAQPGFGAHVEERVSAELATLFTDALTERKLMVRHVRMPVVRSGAKIKGKTLTNRGQAKSPRSYVLSGNWWVWREDDYVELRLKLTNSRHQEISWTGHIQHKEIKEMDLYPSSDLRAMRQNDGRGPIGFHLASDRGKDPKYKIGETIDMLIRLDQKAWLYCFYRQSDGEITQIFPNPYLWEEHKEPFLKAEVQHTIPGPETYPFQLKFREPTGVDLLKCFATGRDVTSELDLFLRGENMEPLPKGIGPKLSSLFGRLPNAEVSEASLVITVTKQ
jgi:hypothetical protein